MEPRQPKIDEADWIAWNHVEESDHEVTYAYDTSEKGEILLKCLDCTWEVWCAP